MTKKNSIQLEIQILHYWFDLAESLITLKDKVEENGDTYANWHHLGVDSFEAYCARLGYSHAVCYQLMNVVRFIKEHQPKLLENHMGNTSGYIPSYPKIRLVASHISEIKPKRRRDRLAMDVFNPEIGRMSIEEKVRELLPRKIEEAELGDSADEDVLQYLSEVKERLLSKVGRGNVQAFKTAFATIEKLFE